MKGVFIINPSDDIAFIWTDRALHQHLNQIAVKRGQKSANEYELDENFLLQFLFPIVASQRSLLSSPLNTSFRSIVGENGFLFSFMMFDEHIYMAINGDKTESESFLHKKLIALQTILTFLHGPILDELKPQRHIRSERWSMIGHLLDKWCHLYATEQSFLVEAVEHLHVNSEITRKLLTLLKAAFLQFKSDADKYVIHAMITVDARVLSFYSSNGTLSLGSSDSLLIILLVNTIFTRDSRASLDTSDGPIRATNASRAGEPIRASLDTSDGPIRANNASRAGEPIRGTDTSKSKKQMEANDSSRSKTARLRTMHTSDEMHAADVGGSVGMGGANSSCDVSESLLVEPMRRVSDGSRMSVLVDYDSVSDSTMYVYKSLVYSRLDSTTTPLTHQSHLVNRASTTNLNSLANEVSTNQGLDRGGSLPPATNQGLDRGGSLPLRTNQGLDRSGFLPLNQEQVEQRCDRSQGGGLDESIRVDEGCREQSTSEGRSESTSLAASTYRRQVVFLQQPSLRHLPHVLHCVHIMEGVSLIFISQIHSMHHADALTRIVIAAHLSSRDEARPSEGGTTTSSDIMLIIDSSVKKLIDVPKLYGSSMNDAWLGFTTTWNDMNRPEFIKEVEQSWSANNSEHTTRRHSSVVRGGGLHLTDQDSPASTPMEYQFKTLYRQALNLLRVLFFNPRALSSSDEELVVKVLDRIRDDVNDALVDFKQFILIMSRNNLSFTAFPPMFPGLVHFLYVQRTYNEMTAPSLCVTAPPPAETADVFDRTRIHDLKSNVWRLQETMHLNVARGLMSMSVRTPPYIYHFNLWFEDETGTTLSVQVPFTGSVNRSDYDGTVSHGFHRRLVRQCFPRATAAAPVHCHELLCVHDAAVPLDIIDSQCQQLAARLSGERRADVARVHLF